MRPIRSFDTTGMPTRIGAEMDFDAKSFVEKKDRRSLKMMARPIQMALAAANLAMAQGRVVRSGIDSTRFGVEFGARADRQRAARAG
ncbi:MAG: hypothetical protein U0736_19015 [Gemmataceae bacterium]